MRDMWMGKNEKLSNFNWKEHYHETKDNKYADDKENPGAGMGRMWRRAKSMDDSARQGNPGYGPQGFTPQGLE
eukprot:TRINITY_DN3061_c0_g1_i1.p1 TRINITY_DN3061_c0_g1~~TRINITY_DN3061_c0_g1_i1.p1  ORF type:complete len:84 (-),score=17.15 TRINITY_DN3061_c0_g1_i1:292-510(-)